MNRFFSPASPRTIRICFFLVTSGYLLALAAGMLLPVYSDETGWRFQERAGIDGFDVLFSDLCGPNTVARAPWLIMPVRWFSAASNLTFASPFFVRLEGVVCAFAWAGLLWLLIRRLEPSREQRRLLGTIAYGLLCLGMLPLLLVMSRPEQPLILTTTLIVLIALHRLPTALSPRLATTLKVTAILILSIIAQSYHMKGVLYAGVAFVAIGVCARGSGTIAPRLIGMGFLIAAALTSAHYWVERLKCEGNAELAAMYAKENVASALVGHKGIGDIASTLLLGTNPLNYVLLAVPPSTPMSLWIPEKLFSIEFQTVIFIMLVILWGSGISSTAYILFKVVKNGGISRLFEPRCILSWALLFSVMIWGASQLNRNVYEAAHVLPMLIVAMLCALTLPNDAGWGIVKYWAFTAPIAAVTALLSLAFVFGALAGPFTAAARIPGFVHGQPLSVSIANYDGIRRNVHAAIAAAGMPTNRRLHRVLIDEVTYLALQDSELPLHRLGVLWVWNGGIEDPAAYLLSRDSDGIVVACGSLDARLRAAATRFGDICAISANTLKAL